jgi:hypothetical protein
MQRFVVVAALLAGSVAHAEDRETVAVLGVVPKDAASTKTATKLDAALRVQSAHEYAVKGTPKEIDAAILSAECSTLQASCAAKLGGNLGAQYAIAGELERRGAHQELVLALFDVRSKRRIRSVHQTSAASVDAKKLARTAYSRLIGGDLGDLQITANVQQGDVLIDGQVVAGLFEGKTTLQGLVKGSHLLAIRAKGYKPFEVDVTIDSATTQTLLLDPE